MKKRPESTVPSSFSASAKEGNCESIEPNTSSSETQSRSYPKTLEFSFLFRIPTLAKCLFLIAITLVAYWPIFRAEFLPFDDQEYVYLNPNVADGFSFESLHWAFMKVSVSNWHPLTWMSHMLDAEVFDLNPHGHHAMSVFWHVANAVLLFLVLEYLTGQSLPSFCLALLFALHPTHVEVVSWVAQRKTLLSTFLTLLVIAAYAAYVRKRSWRWYGVSLSLFALSLMAKQTFVTMPLLLVLLDFWPLRRGDVNRGTGTGRYWAGLIRSAITQFPDKLPYGVLGFAAALITLMAQTDAMQTLDSFPVVDRLGNVSIAYCRYLAGIFWPLPLSIYYTIHLERINLVTVASSALAVTSISAISLIASRRHPYLLTGWFWFLISMLPVIGIVHVGSQSMADRYLYNASFGVFLAVVWFCWHRVLLVSEGRTLLNVVSQRTAVWALSTLVLIVCICLATATFFRCQRWQTVLGTFQEALVEDPTNWLAHRILAEKYIELRDYESAIFHAKAALEEFEDSGFYVLQAIALRELDERPKATELLSRAIELNPDDALAYSLMAIVQSEMGRSQAALKMLEVAEQKAELPKNRVYRRVPSLILRNCGIALLAENRPQEALERFEAARKWDSRDVGLIYEAAEAELKLGRVEQAIERLSGVLSAEPDNPGSFSLLGRAYKQAGQLDQAEPMLRRSLELESTNTLTALQLSDLLLQTGRADEARQILERSLQEVLSRKNSQEKARWLAELNSQLGDVNLAKKDLSGAISAYREALRHWSDQFSASNNLAWLLATEKDSTIRDPEQAVRLAEHANQLPGGKEKGSLGTLAAAYAAAGRMEEAVRSAEDALAVAESQNNPAVVQQLRQQLEQHRMGQALFESNLATQPSPPQTP